jgi:hypothetical protein
MEFLTGVALGFAVAVGMLVIYEHVSRPKDPK